MKRIYSQIQNFTIPLICECFDKICLLYYFTIDFFLQLQAGSVQVRVRRDANEQLVLAHVYNRLSNLVSTLTIQIFKDDWTRASTYSFMGSNPAFPSNYNYSGPSLLPGHGTPTSQDSSFSSPANSSFSQSDHGHSHGGHGHSHGGQAAFKSSWWPDTDWFYRNFVCNFSFVIFVYSFFILNYAM